MGVRTHDFLIGLTEAIASATDALPDEAFRYRGADLRAVVERDLWVRCSNSVGLHRAFSEGPRVRVATELETAVAHHLVGDRAVGPGAARRWRLARAAARGLAAPAAITALDSGVPAAETWFLLDHPKFLALVEPVARALGQTRARVLWASAHARPPVRAGDPALDELPDVPPTRVRDAGRAVRGEWEWLRELDRAAAAIARLQPARLVVVEGNSPYDALGAAAGERAGIPTVCIQNGWSPIVHAGFRRMPYRRMLVWGQGFTDILAPHNPGLELLATGHPTLAEPQDEGSGLAAAVGGRPAAAFFLQPPSPYNTPEHLATFEGMIEAVGEAAPDAALIVRPHPSGPLRERAWPANVVLASGPAIGLRETILAAGTVVSIYSTSLLEGAAMGRPAVSLNQTSLPRLSPDLEAEGAGLELDDPAAATDAVLALLSEGPGDRFAEGMARVRQRYLDGLRPGAAARAAAAIAALQPR